MTAASLAASAISKSFGAVPRPRSAPGSRCAPARSTPSSARTAPASRRSPRSSPASTGGSGRDPCSTALAVAFAGRRRMAAPASASCRKRCRSWDR